MEEKFSPILVAPDKNHNWHVKGKKGVGDEEDVIQIIIQDKLMKAVVTEVTEEKTCCLLSHGEREAHLIWQVAAPQFKEVVSVPALNSDDSHQSESQARVHHW